MPGGDTDDVTYVAGQTTVREEILYLYMAHHEGWFQDSEVSVEQVRKVVPKFVEGNVARSETFEWREWREGVR